MILLNSDISSGIKRLIDELGVGLRSLDGDALQTASLPLTDLRNELREVIQEKLREPTKDIMKKLKRDKDLSPGDLHLIEKWIVGDAEYYTEMENNFNEWVEECKRLRTSLEYYTSSSLEKDEVNLFKLNALITDLKFTLDDVIRYVEAKERIRRFRESIGTGTLDRETKKWLADMIKRQLASGEF